MEFIFQVKSSSSVSEIFTCFIKCVYITVNQGVYNVQEFLIFMSGCWCIKALGHNSLMKPSVGFKVEMIFCLTHSIGSIMYIREADLIIIKYGCVNTSSLLSDILLLQSIYNFLWVVGLAKKFPGVMQLWLIQIQGDSNGWLPKIKYHCVSMMDWGCFFCSDAVTLSLMLVTYINHMYSLKYGNSMVIFCGAFFNVIHCYSNTWLVTTWYHIHQPNCKNGKEVILGIHTGYCICPTVRDT